MRSTASALSRNIESSCSSGISQNNPRCPCPALFTRMPMDIPADCSSRKISCGAFSCSRSFAMITGSMPAAQSSGQSVAFARVPQHSVELRKAHRLHEVMVDACFA